MEKKKAHQGMLFVLPSLIGMSLFFVIPFFISIEYAFTQKQGTRQFVGLRHFMALMANEAFKKAVKNTFTLLGLGVPLLVAGSLIAATFLEKQFQEKKYIGGILLLPMAIPTSSILLFWQELLAKEGGINRVLGLHVDWLNSRYAIVVIVFMIVWKYLGYHVLIVLSSLLTMPKEFEEAASLDGAGAWTILIHIKVPYLMPIMFFNMVMAVMNGLKIYREIYLLQGDYPNEDLYMIQHFMNNYFAKLELEKLSAAAFMLYLFLFLLIGGMSKLQQKLLREEG